MQGRPRAKCTPSTNALGVTRGKTGATGSRSWKPIHEGSRGILGLSLAFGLVTGLPTPVASRPYLDQPSGAQSSQTGAQEQNPKHGQCEAGREWSQNRLQNLSPSHVQTGRVAALGYMGQTIGHNDPNIAEAKTQVERVVRVSGLEMNFELVINPSTPAAAEIVNSRRVILFDPHFMAQVADRICPDWGATSILAHEVGHHLAGHTLRQSAEPWRDELEADDFSGFVMARLGATLAEATSAAARILPEQATPTHPGRADRIAAIVHGWQNAKALLTAERSQSGRNRTLTPMPQSPFDPDDASTASTHLGLAARIILYNDPNDYYVTLGGRIDAYDGTRRPIGRKGIPSTNDYAWTFHADGLRLNVALDGRIWVRLPSGFALEVGLVVPLAPQAVRVASGE